MTPSDDNSAALLARGPSSSANRAAVESRAISKIIRRLIPFIGVLYVVNYLDRVNVSFAKLAMNADLGFSETVYGLGASIFFVGYFLFELPSNLMMMRFGARLWIARIMVSWGLVSTAMMFVKTPASFYAIRFLLGVAEAGFFPAIILYFTHWIPAKRRAGATSWFLTAIAVAGILGGPISGAVLSINAFGIAGWRWLFLLEGAPAVVLGFVVFVILPDSPQQAKWLSTDERQAVLDSLEAERSTQPANAHRLRLGLVSPIVWQLALLYGLLVFAFYGLGYWTPSIIKQISSASTFIVGCLSAIPSAAAILGMLIVGQWADRAGSGLFVVGWSLLLGAAGSLGAAFCASTAATVFCLSIAAIGVYGSLAPFWTIPPKLLRGSAIAASIAIINSVGNLGGGLIGPNVFAQLRERHASFSQGLIANTAMLILAATLAFTLSLLLKRSKPALFDGSGRELDCATAVGRLINK